MEDAERIWSRAKQLGIEKWAAGKAQHGGSLPRKPVLRESVGEAIDMVSYLLVKVDQDEEAKSRLADALSVMEYTHPSYADVQAAFRILHYGNPEGEH